MLAGFWAGLTYSAKVRRSDYDMAADFDSALRALIVAPALAERVYRPIEPAEPLVEAVFLDKEGRRSVALMNWGYHRDPQQASARGLPPSPVIAENLRVELLGVGRIESVRSLRHGPLPVRGQGAERHVVLPTIEEIDLLVFQ